MANTRASLVLLLAFFTVTVSYAQYVGTPHRDTTINAVLRRSVDLRCEYRGGGDDGEFTEWYKDKILISSEKPGHYVVKESKHETILTIKIFVINDSFVKQWSVKTNKKGHKGSACEFKQIAVTPSPQSINTNLDTEILDSPNASIRRVEDELVTLKCNIEPQPTHSNRERITWEYSADGKSFSHLPDGVTHDTNDVLKIEHVKKDHRGYYQCTVNKLPFQVILRVKDKLAALWPFLGIVTVVVLLVLLILVFERRQKNTRKTVAIDDNNHDHTKDSLVRAANNASDNDNKKRAIKA